jgi:glycosyltransferase involved in cell wall biosynthesis
LEAFSPEKVSDEKVKSFRDSLGLKNKDLLFVMIAEFNPGKRHTDTLEAFFQLHREDTHLALVGKGPLEIDMRKKSLALGIADKVHFLGHRTDITVILKATKALILSSEREGLPRVVMEAMSMGVPVIASNIRGARDLLGTGGGRLFPVRDVTALKRSMEEVIFSRKISASLSMKGKQIIKDYGIGNILLAHEELYGRLLPK